MEKGNTRQQILQAALELFSTQGFEATSMSQIADAVGIRKASVYSHFESKQALLDALLQETLEQYDRYSLFAGADWDDPAFTAARQDIPPDRAVEKILQQVRYILHDPQISRSRKMLTIEQFRNPTLGPADPAELYGGAALFYRPGALSHPPGQAGGGRCGGHGGAALPACFRMDRTLRPGAGAGGSGDGADRAAYPAVF